MARADGPPFLSISPPVRISTLDFFKSSYPRHWVISPTFVSLQSRALILLTMDIVRWKLSLRSSWVGGRAPPRRLRQAEGRLSYQYVNASLTSHPCHWQGLNTCGGRWRAHARNFQKVWARNSHFEGGDPGVEVVIIVKMGHIYNKRTHLLSGYSSTRMRVRGIKAYIRE